MYEPDVVYEITSRTIQARFLLRPSANANELIAGVIGEAQAAFGSALHIHAVVVLSNHITWLISSPFPWLISKFIGYVHGNISREIGRIHDWSGKLWSRPARPIACVDEASQLQRFRYVIAHGAKEGLVESPRDWPGVSCVPTLLGEGELRGTWFDRNAYTHACRRKKPRDWPCQYEFSRAHVVTFDPLPCLAHLTPAEYRDFVADQIADIEEQTRREFPPDTRPVLGVGAILRTHPHDRPGSSKKSPAPLCHAATRSAFLAYRDKYRMFVEAFRAGSAWLRQKGGAGLEQIASFFPVYAFPPGMPMVMPSG